MQRARLIVLDCLIVSCALLFAFAIPIQLYYFSWSELYTL
ncbi:hypothetical protein HMPREF3216_00526 [Gardnerella vaginalis]|uniref:Uncharacterized protein n=1 Tax=Gardnerella vaginalis TaxID=2702 RepID=A0A133NQ36_GARVA|nr:hypothetical protein HMPREF3216_00526 [Gardnerella vaginalis]